jgi:hypothetical protein
VTNEYQVHDQVLKARSLPSRMEARASRMPRGLTFEVPMVTRRSL